MGAAALASVIVVGGIGWAMPPGGGTHFEALQELPLMQRKVIVLRHWLGLDVRETARELNIAQGTVKSHSSRGLATLQKALAEPITR